MEVAEIVHAGSGRPPSGKHMHTGAVVKVFANVIVHDLLRSPVVIFMSVSVDP